MSPLREALKDYLTIRRSLGYQLYSQELLLNDFVAFLERAGTDTVTIELAVCWARLPQDAKPAWWARRLGVVRTFARYLVTIDPRTEVPPKDLLPARAQRLAPYIYSPAETRALMAAADALQPRLRGATHRTLIGLLASTGLRLGEALGLDRQEVDLDDGVLRVRGKDAKWREVPLHPTTTRALGDYVRLRDQQWPQPNTPAFFVCTTGERLQKWVVHKTFPQLIRQAGLEGCGQRARPRPHDFRHYADGWVMRPVRSFGLVRALPVGILSA
ncbi:MAG: tyrosine-type recombinase/integrase [Actinomycetota bacterium]|nr:tyrosine-type recombinase/integrase [Actinomycetota bacterium]